MLQSLTSCAPSFFIHSLTEKEAEPALGGEEGRTYRTFWHPLASNLLFWLSARLPKGHSGEGGKVENASRSLPFTAQGKRDRVCVRAESQTQQSIRQRTMSSQAWALCASTSLSPLQTSPTNQTNLPNRHSSKPGHRIQPRFLILQDELREERQDKMHLPEVLLLSQRCCHPSQPPWISQF